MMRNKPKGRGLTVIELMVVVAVVGVLAALAAPSLREFMARQRVAAVNAELVTDLQYARSEAISRGWKVRVRFLEDDEMTCYSIYTFGVIGNCDCRKPLGTACPNGIDNLTEIKSTQVPKSTTVTVKPQGGDLIFTEPRGLTNSDEFRVTVASSISGQLRTDVNRVGRPQVCSPDGSMKGVSACAQ